MSGLFGNFGFDPRMQRQALVSKYNAARINLIAVVVFTAINMVTLATNVGSYFLFSANMPYMLTFLSLFLCGMLPQEYYAGAEGMFYLNKAFFVISLIVSILILLLYVACWWFSKKGKVLWIKVALGLFIVDTLALFIFGSAGMLIVDIIFHVWVIAILISGIKAHANLKALPKEEVMIEADFTELPVDGEPSNEESASYDEEENASAELETPMVDARKIEPKYDGINTESGEKTE